MKEINILLLGCIFLGLIAGSKSTFTPVIQTIKGPVRGEVLKTVVKSIKYSSFKGIPYAEPPLGYLRFKPPVPKSSWTDVLETTIEGANCIQKDFIYRTNYTGSEDCLYLNVYTPQLKFENVTSDLKPVIVWIYGGSFKGGYGNSSLYGPDFMIEEDVVLVTFNYRLGPLGFLNLDHENATGNTGLKDQNLVLRWVNENIANFGGNPDSVTLFGQSAGGVAVDLHGLSEMSKGLFHRSIAMSSSPLCPWGFHAPEVAMKQAFALGKKLGKATRSKDELLKTLYETPAVKIIEAAEEMGKSDPPFKPTVENINVAKGQEKFLSECPYSKYTTGHINKVPHLTGFTSHETLLFAGSIESILDMVTFAANVIKTFPASSPIPLPITSKVAAILADGTKQLSNALVMELISETSDILFVAGIDLKQKFIYAHSGHPVYYYRFSYDTPKSLHRQIFNVTLNGTAHGDDFGYPFHMIVTDLPLDSNDSTFITRKRMTRLWTNFAKYSNPTPNGEKDTLLQGITWPDSGIKDHYLDFGKDLINKVNPTSTTADLVKTANLVTLPIQTGCFGDVLKKIANLNPFHKDSFLGHNLKGALTKVFPKASKPLMG